MAAPLHETTSSQKRSGGTCCQGITVFPAHRQVYPRMERTTPAFAFSAEAVPYLPTPKGWEAELELGSTNKQLLVYTVLSTYVVLVYTPGDGGTQQLPSSFDISHYHETTHCSYRLVREVCQSQSCSLLIVTPHCSAERPDRNILETKNIYFKFYSFFTFKFYTFICL